MRLLIPVLLLASAGASAQGTGEIRGRVLEHAFRRTTAVIGATVRVDGTALGAATGIDGEYRISDVPVGMHSVEAIFAGLEAKTQTGVEVALGEVRKVSFVLERASIRDDTDALSTCNMPSLISVSPFASRIIFGDGIDSPDADEPWACLFPAIRQGG